MTFDQLLLEKFEEALEKDLKDKPKKESLTIVNKFITSLERIRKRLGKEITEEIRNSLIK